MDLEAFEQQRFISHSAGVWEVQDGEASIVSVWSGHASLLTDGCLLAVSSHGRKGKRALWGLL